MIRITAKRDGFRRAGLAHPAGPTDYPDDTFTADQLAQLQAEPMLVVEILTDAEGDKAAPGTDGQAATDGAPAKPAAKPATRKATS